VRLRSDGKFREPGLVRYGIVKTDWPEVAIEVTQSDSAVVFETGSTRLNVNRADGSITFSDASGKVLIENAAPPHSAPEGGFDAAFFLKDGERLYGLGDETRDCLQKRGHETPMVLRNVVSYVPIPFLMSTDGWAIFLNST